MKKSILYPILLSFILLTCSCAPQNKSNSDRESLIPIKLPVGYIPNVQFSPIYMAMEKGYFLKEGLDVTIDYSMEMDNVALVGANKIPFAIASGEQVLLGRAQQLPVVYVMAWYQQYPVGIAAKTSSGINTPASLKGKKIGVPVLSGASYIGLRALLSAGQLKETDVSLDVIGYTQVESLVTDKDQAVVIYIANEPVQLKAKGYDINVLKVADYEQLVANGLITNEKTLKENPDLVRKVIRGLINGMQAAMENPDEAYEISKKYVENLDKADSAIQKQVLAESIELWKAKKIGKSEDSAWTNMQEILINSGLLKERLDIHQAFTNDFLP